MRERWKRLAKLSGGDVATPFLFIKKPGPLLDRACEACEAKCLNCFDGLHSAHCLAEFLADVLDVVLADDGIDGDEGLVVHAGVRLAETFSDDGGVDAGHELFEKRHGGVREEVATIFGSVGNDVVHFEELLPRDRVGDERSLVEGLVVSGLRLDAGLDHGLEGEFHSSADHGYHEDAFVEIFLLGDLSFTFSLFELGFTGCFAPAEEVEVVVCPVSHHGAGELTGDDIVHVLVEKVPHYVLQFLGENEGFDLSGVGKTIHHVGDATVLESFGDDFPAVLDEFDSPFGVDAIGLHLFEAEDGTRLEKPTENSLFAHEVGLHFGNEGGLKNASLVTTLSDGECFSEFDAFTGRIVFTVAGNESWDAEAALVFLAHFRARRLGSDHDDGEVFANLGAFFDDIKSVGVGEGGAFLHMRDDCFDNLGVLLVRSEVHDDVGGGKHLLVGADSEAIFGRVEEGLALFSDGGIAEGVGNIESRVAHVEALVETLSAATDDDDLESFGSIDAIGELGGIHEAASAELIELAAEREGIEVVIAHRDDGLID